MTPEERSELIHRPFFIVRLSSSYLHGGCMTGVDDMAMQIREDATRKHATWLPMRPNYIIWNGKRYLVGEGMFLSLDGSGCLPCSEGGYTDD